MEQLYNSIENAWNWMTRPSIPNSIKTMTGANECDKTPHNQDMSCPAWMGNGRQFTSHESPSDYHYKIGKELNLQTQKEFREYVQRNGNLFKKYIDNLTNTGECIGNIVELPPPERVYEVTKEGIKYYETNLPNGIGVMEKRQWEEIVQMEMQNIQRIRRERKTHNIKCNKVISNKLANREDILRTNRMALYSGVPKGIGYQNL
jgi:hypothetical protein